MVRAASRGEGITKEGLDSSAVYASVYAIIAPMNPVPRRVLCVFAHPDDEVFGPGGTIALWAKQGAQIYLLCMTHGENGDGPHPKKTALIRSWELKTSAKILGVKTVEFLDFPDGHIGNSDLQKLEVAITRRVRSFQPDTLLTFNLNGVSGHLDHIAVASAVTQSFKKTKIAKLLYYFTVPKAISRLNADYFIYFPDGPDPTDMDEVIDVSSVWDIRIKAMEQHQSQEKDVEAVKSELAMWEQKECFMVRRRTAASSSTQKSNIS